MSETKQFLTRRQFTRAALAGLGLTVAFPELAFADSDGTKEPLSVACTMVHEFDKKGIRLRFYLTNRTKSVLTISHRGTKAPIPVPHIEMTLANQTFALKLDEPIVAERIMTRAGPRPVSKQLPRNQKMHVATFLYGWPEQWGQAASKFSHKRATLIAAFAVRAYSDKGYAPLSIASKPLTVKLPKLG